MRLLCAACLIAAALPAQLAILDPNLSASVLVNALPGPRHQIGTDASGTIYVADEVPGGFAFGSTIHALPPGGAFVAAYIGTGVVSVGQMVRDLSGGSCHFINHWQGALEHNQVVRIESTPAITPLHDVLWGEGHGLAQNAAGDWFVGVPSGVFGPAQIWTIPAGQLGQVQETAWAPGAGQNRFLAPENGAAMLCADGTSVWRVQPGAPNVAVYTHATAPGTTVEWRGLCPNPFGAGHVASLVESAAGAASVTTLVLWIGPGGPRPLASIAEPPPGDGGIAGDGSGGLLLSAGGQLFRLAPVAPPLQPPGVLLAPVLQPVAQPMTVTLTGRIFALSPFVFAVDLPLGPPLFPGGVLPIPPLGVAHTSLGLQSSFIPVRDGLGAFGPADPVAFIGAGGTFDESYPLPSLLAGLTLVLQGYVLDLQAPNGLLRITPPVFTTFI